MQIFCTFCIFFCKHYSHFAREISRLAALSMRSSDIAIDGCIASMSIITNFGLLFLNMTAHPLSSTWRTTLLKFWFASVIDTI